MAWVLLLSLGLLCLAAPHIAPHDPRSVDLPHNLAPPSTQNLLGTDLLGRDIFSRLLYGGRQTLLMGIGATLIAGLAGLLLGLLAADERLALNLPIVSLIDALLAAPSLLIALVGVSLLGKGLGSLILAVGIAGIGAYARTTQDSITAIRAMPYIEAARSIGMSEGRILWRHILPNTRPILLSFLGVTFSWALLNGAALAFLGFSGAPETPDWGLMLAAGRQTFAVAPYEALSAGVLLTLTVGAVNRLTR